MAFLDINPRMKGHAVVIPKKHATTLLDLDEVSLSTLFQAVQKTAKQLIGTLGATGFNIGNNNDKTAGQVVPHVHVHILPRYKEDKFQHAGFEAAFPVDEEAKGQIEKIHKQVTSGSAAHSTSTDSVSGPVEEEKPTDPSKPKERESIFIRDDYPDDDELI